MPRQWTTDQKLKQSLLIHQWLPWLQSTGAKTPEGKARSSKNAVKTGQYSTDAIADKEEISDILREARELLNRLKNR